MRGTHCTHIASSPGVIPQVFNVARWGRGYVHTHAYIDDHSDIVLQTCSCASMCVLHTQVRVQLVGIPCVLPWILMQGSSWQLMSGPSSVGQSRKETQEDSNR